MSSPHHPIARVQGDTATALAVARAVATLGIPVGHVEAGLRTYDFANPYPEEMYRQAIARIAQLHFAPTAVSEQNLPGEGIGAERERIDALLGIALSWAQARIAFGRVTAGPCRTEVEDDQAVIDFSRPHEELMSWIIDRLEHGVTHVTHPRSFGLFNRHRLIPLNALTG